ncbi:MAG TPA: S41 family peptidase [Solirubrobacteraceae bacterium]|jgi:carboxyl-terminal processing protease|nr:S41 family peptidase [Solirubrobacteraceae bacterium]
MGDRRRQPLAFIAALAVVVVALLALVAFGIWWGGHPEDLPGFMQRVFVANRSTRVVDEALARIHNDYYRPIGTAQLANASIAGAVASLNDPFSHYLTAKELGEFDHPGSFSGIGVEVNPDPRGLRIVQVFNGSPAARAGLHPENVIVAVNGRSLAGVPEDKATDLVKGPSDTDVTLRVEQPAPAGRSVAAGGAAVPGAGKGGHPPPFSLRTRTVTLTRTTISQPVVASLTPFVDGVKLGVVALAEFSAGAHAEVLEAVENELQREHVRGLVLDLRSNPGGLVEEAQLIASIFLPRGAVVVTTRGRVQPTQVLRALGGAIPASIPLVVLVDRNTASAAEILTGALQDHRRATVIGTHTFGKGVFQEEQPLANGGALDITVGEYFTPNGHNLGGGGVHEGAGLTPEVKVSPSLVDTPHGLAVALRTLAAKVR